MRLLLLVICCLSVNQCLLAQQVLSLPECIALAQKNSLQLKLSEIGIAQNELSEQQARFSQYPNLNGGFGNGVSFGRSINPITNQFIQQGYYYNGFSMNSDVLLFGWYGRKYQRELNSLQTLASKAQYEQVQNDLSLNVATGYLRVLLAKAQQQQAQLQLQNNLEQSAVINKRVAAGALPLLNKAQMDVQLSTDSANLLNAELEIAAALLDLKALMNIPLEERIDIVTPSAQTLDNNLNSVADPELIYSIALQQQPSLKQAAFNIKAAQQQIKIAQAAQYPSISAGWSLGTNYASTVREIESFKEVGQEAIGSIKFGDSLIPIFRPKYEYKTRLTPVFRQYGNNIRQTISVNIGIPIFNGLQSKQNIQRAKLGLQQQQILQQQSAINLQQTISRACNNYKSSVQRYQQAMLQVKSAELALDFAQKRFDAGYISVQELLTQQAAVQRAKIGVLQAKYDAVFKAKILDFYSNKPIAF